MATATIALLLIQLSGLGNFAYAESRFTTAPFTGGPHSLAHLLPDVIDCLDPTGYHSHCINFVRLPTEHESRALADEKSIFDHLFH